MWALRLDFTPTDVKDTVKPRAPLSRWDHCLATCYLIAPSCSCAAVFGRGDPSAEDVSSFSTLPVPSCSSARDVVGGGCIAAAPLNTAKSPFHEKIAPLPIVRKVPKSRRALRHSTLSVYGVVMEDEEAGRWEVLGRGEAELPVFSTLLIANFVVDASCCSNLWQNPGRVLTWLWSAHDFASGSRSHMHFALSIPSKELALEFSDAFYDATIGDGSC